VLFSLGISKINIIKTFFLFSLSIIFFHLVVSIYLLPISSSKFKKLRLEINQNSIVNLLQFNTFVSKINGITIYIEKKEKDNLLKNIFIFNSKDPEKDITFIANSGRFYNTDSGVQLSLNDGSRLEYSHKSKRYSLVKFSQSSLTDINELENVRAKSKQNRYEFTIPELLFSNDFPDNKIGEFRAQGHFRLLWPLTSISLVLLVLFFLTQHEQNRAHIIYIFSSAGIIIGSMIALYMLDHARQKYYIIMYAINILVPVLICYLLYSYDKRQMSILNKVSFTMSTKI
jgi:lipopolysaccharide export system permease protein